MNKKILVVSILVVFTLLAISFATAVSSNTTKTVEKKESPLYGIRTRRVIGEKLGKILENIKTRFLGERLFFLPFQWLKNTESHSFRELINGKITIKCSIIIPPTCPYTMCTCDCNL